MNNNKKKKRRKNYIIVIDRIDGDDNIMDDGNGLEGEIVGKVIAKIKIKKNLPIIILEIVIHFI